MSPLKFTRYLCEGVCLFFAAGLWSAHAAPMAFTRGPFVQNATSNSIQIIWRTSVPASTFLEFGAASVQENLVTNGLPDTNHVVTLSNLAPDTRYYYRVGSQTGSETLVSSPESFRTFKPAGPISFVVFGDTGGTGGITTAAATNVATVARNLSPDLVIHLGDATADGFSEARADKEYFSMYYEHIRSTPYFLCAGNHDLETGYGVWGDTLATNFQNTWYLPTNSMDGTERYYSFDHGDVHFVCLYNPWFRNYVFTIDSPQYQWLTNDLAASVKPWKLVFLHSPIAHSGNHFAADHNANTIWDQYEMMGLIAPLAQRYGVQMVFGSHDHNYERFAPTNGLHHCVSAGGGRRLYQMLNQHPASAQFRATYHCVRVGITNDTMTCEAFGTNGVVFDAFTVQKALPPASVYQATWNTPVIESAGTNDGDGNLLDQRFDFQGPPLLPRAGRFSNLGRVYVNNDATNLYIGFEQVMLYRDNNLFLFVAAPRLAGVTTMEGVGNGVIDPASQGVDGLDVLENLSFTNFAPAVGGLLGDEWADGQYRSYSRSNFSLNIGQGVFRLDAGLSTISGVQLQQYNRSPQTGALTNGVRTEQNADFIELSIPLAELGGVLPGETIQIAALVGGGDFDAIEQTRQLDTAALAVQFSGSGFDHVVLEGLQVQLASDPDWELIRAGIEAAPSGQITISWNSTIGRQYTVETSEGLSGFAPLQDPRLPLTATESVTRLTLTPPSPASKFYRVRLLP